MTSRPASPTQDLWSSILDSVSKSRSTPSKQILLLGEPRTGKSSLAAALLQKPLDHDQTKDDFALGFDWADVRDDADEDTLARLSVYTVQSSNPVHTALVPNVLPPKTSIPNSLVMIILDWAKPWTFVEQLEIWFNWIDNWAKGDGSRELEVTREEGKERLLYHLQHYTEPSDEPLPLTTAAYASSTLPLPQGTFTSNSAGVPIIVVCTRSDLIDDNSDIAGVGASGMGGMVKSKGGEWEERTDGVMQVLRTVCLKYGAALFYSTLVPTTTAVLRQYALHFLFTPNPPQPAIGSTEIPAPARNPFAFTHAANALDRDKIVIPAGWDSWGKIAILRDGFEASRWGEAWERDMESFAYASASSNPQIKESTLVLAPAGGARALFSTLVGADRGPPPRSLPPIIQPTPEQVFLQQHYENLAKDPSRDPRATFRQPTADGLGAQPSGVVGPLGTSSFSLPSVEKALVDMESSADKDKERDRNTGGTRSSAQSGPTSSRRDTIRPPALQQAPMNSNPSGRPAASPVGSAGGKGQTQHEVLHNFFQSLLTSRTGGGSANAAATSPTASANPPAKNASTGTDGAAQAP